LLATACLCFHQINETAVVQEVRTSLFPDLDLTLSRSCWFTAVSIIDAIALGLSGVHLGHVVSPRPY
jgi:hypothetical protein